MLWGLLWCPTPPPPPSVANSESAVNLDLRPISIRRLAGFPPVLCKRAYRSGNYICSCKMSIGFLNIADKDPTTLYSESCTCCDNLICGQFILVTEQMRLQCCISCWVTYQRYLVPSMCICVTSQNLIL